MGRIEKLESRLDSMQCDFNLGMEKNVEDTMQGKTSNTVEDFGENVYTFMRRLDRPGETETAVKTFILKIQIIQNI